MAPHLCEGTSPWPIPAYLEAWRSHTQSGAQPLQARCLVRREEARPNPSSTWRCDASFNHPAGNFPTNQGTLQSITGAVDQVSLPAGMQASSVHLDPGGGGWPGSAPALRGARWRRPPLRPPKTCGWRWRAHPRRALAAAGCAAAGRRGLGWCKEAPIFCEGTAPWPAASYLKAWRTLAQSGAQPLEGLTPRAAPENPPLPGLT
jgi:hypothetical protein